jgi:hypothetical protein
MQAIADLYTPVRGSWVLTWIGAEVLSEGGIHIHKARGQGEEGVFLCR